MKKKAAAKQKSLSGFALPKAMTIDSAEALAAELSSATQETSTEPFLLDGSAVEIIGSAGIQLLLSLEKTLTAGRRPLQLRAASAAVAHAFQEAGLSHFYAHISASPSTPAKVAAHG